MSAKEGTRSFFTGVAKGSMVVTLGSVAGQILQMNMLQRDIVQT